MEGEKKYPHMCGGVLATILLSHKRDKSPTGHTDPLNQNNFIRDLSRIVKPGFEFSSDSNPDPVVSYYVNCRKKTSSVLPFSQEKHREAFRRQMEESYPLLLHRMDLFLSKYVDMNDLDDLKIIIQEILSIAAHDHDCIVSWLFVLPNGEKTSLNKLTDIHFQPFILGIWYYIISHKVSNVVENEIYDGWKQSRSRMRFKGDLILDNIPPISEEVTEELPLLDDIQPIEDEDIAEAEPEILDAPENSNVVKDQTLISHNGRIYNQHAEKIANIEHVDTLYI